MVWTVRRIEADFFMGFRRLDLDLTKYKGITSIEGERASPGTSNGASKSTIFEAIHWALRGKLMRRLRKAEKVMHRWMPADGRTVVRLTVDVDGREFLVERIRTKSGTTLRTHMQGEPVKGSSTIEGVQGTIDATLGLYDDRTLTSTAIFSGGLAQFCQLTDAERKAALERMVGADHYSAAAKLAGERASAADQTAIAASGREQYATRELESLVGDRQRAMTQQIGLAAVSQQKETDLRDDVTRAAILFRKEHDTLVEFYTGALEAERAAANVRAGIEYRRDTAAQEVEKARVEAQEVEKSLAVSRSKVSDLRRQRSDLERGKHPDICPHCSQRWPHQGADPAHLAKALKRFDADINAEAVLVAPQESRLATLSQVRSEADQRRRRADAELAELTAAVDPVRERRFLAAALQSEANLNAAMDTLNRHRATMPDPEWGELTVECPEIDARIEEVRGRIDVEKAAAEDARSLSRRFQFWKRGFGKQGMPSYLLDSSIPAMNETVGRLANLLTNGELSVSFNPAAAKGAGEMFAVDVEYRDGGADYDMTSTGEHTRVDLCVMFALRDLVERRGGNRCTQLFLDELFQGTDAAFAESCMAMLRSEYGDRDIFLISHDDAVKSLCDGTILVKKAGRSAVIA